MFDSVGNFYFDVFVYRFNSCETQNVNIIYVCKKIIKLKQNCLILIWKYYVYLQQLLNFTVKQNTNCPQKNSRHMLFPQNLVKKNKLNNKNKLLYQIFH